MDVERLGKWARLSGLPDRYDRAGSVCGWRDSEIAFDVRHEDDGWAVHRRERGGEQRIAWFAEETDAERLLLIRFGSVWRWRMRLPDPFPPRDDAPGVTVTRTDAGYVVAGACREVTVPNRNDAWWFSYTLDLPLDELAAVLGS